MIERVRREASTFLRFATVGGIGFIIDGALLQAIVTLLHLQPTLARVFSFAIALAATFFLNRAWGFSSRSASIGGQALRYAAVQITGGAVNYAVFAALTSALHLSGALLWLAMAAGSGVGLIVNFIGARLFVFAADEPAPVTPPKVQTPANP